uniref:Silicatein alpha n=1 Tax=Mycale phyllophila TaxID=1325607 RepID=A0A172QB91_9METZ|nr:silicatein alpha [Mycale phyllophila]
MLGSAVFLALMGLALAFSSPQYKFVEEWKLWKGQHQKSYEGTLEELTRHIVWLSNKQYIEAHNQNAHIFGYTLAMNNFADLTDQEWAEKFGTYDSDGKGNYTRYYKPDALTYYPDSVDWRTKNAVTSVKDQSQCGASYAFSAVAAMEGANALATGKLTVLSEQNIIDCSVPFGNHGCKGGNMDSAFDYVITNEGLDVSDAYPFQGKQQSCVYSDKYTGVKISGMVRIQEGSESHLLGAVANVGPVSVAIDGSSNAFRFYDSGVYDSSRCSSSTLNHAMVVTGYGTTSDGKDYWLVKNSFGEKWGEDGYVRMVRGKYNQCGIASDASYPTL